MPATGADAVPWRPDSVTLSPARTPTAVAVVSAIQTPADPVPPSTGRRWGRNPVRVSSWAWTSGGRGIWPVPDDGKADADPGAAAPVPAVSVTFDPRMVSTSGP